MTKDQGARVDPALLAGNRRSLADYRAAHFQWRVDAGVGTITLNRPERKNPLTFESYAELRDLFGQLTTRRRRPRGADQRRRRQLLLGRRRARDHRPAGAAEGPELLMFTRMTGDLVKAMRVCPQPVVAAIDGVCAGRGRDRRDGLGPAPGDRAQQDRVPVQPRRARRLRHGRLRDAAADHRPGPRERAALHRARDVAGTRPSAGVSSIACARPRRCTTRRSRWRANFARARASPTASPRRCSTRSGR